VDNAMFHTVLVDEDHENDDQVKQLISILEERKKPMV